MDARARHRRSTMWHREDCSRGDSRRRGRVATHWHAVERWRQCSFRSTEARRARRADTEPRLGCIPITAELTIVAAGLALFSELLELQQVVIDTWRPS